MKKEKLLSMKDMQPVAQLATRAMLEAEKFEISDEDRKDLVLGQFSDDNYGYFEIQLLGETYQETQVVSRATVDRRTGEVKTVMYPPTRP